MAANNSVSMFHNEDGHLASFLNVSYAQSWHLFYFIILLKAAAVCYFSFFLSPSWRARLQTSACHLPMLPGLRKLELSTLYSVFLTLAYPAFGFSDFFQFVLDVLLVLFFLRVLYHIYEDHMISFLILVVALCAFEWYTVTHVRDRGVYSAEVFLTYFLMAFLFFHLRPGDDLRVVGALYAAVAVRVFYRFACLYSARGWQPVEMVSVQQALRDHFGIKTFTTTTTTPMPVRTYILHDRFM